MNSQRGVEVVIVIYFYKNNEFNEWRNLLKMKEQPEL